MKRTCWENDFKGGGTKMHENIVRCRDLVAREFHENQQIIKLLIPLFSHENFYNNRNLFADNLFVIN